MPNKLLYLTLHIDIRNSKDSISAHSINKANLFRGVSTTLQSSAG